MNQQALHPSQEELSAYSLGHLPEERAAAIDSHISECEPCCETIVNMSSHDTFIDLLQEAQQLQTGETLDQFGMGARPSARGGDIPPALAEHPRYEIVRLIGKGGMGDVYEALHRKMERRVALKVINRDLFRKTAAVNRFHREVKAAAQLSHPNVVTSHDADQAGDYHFMVMEYVDGVDLSQIVKEQGALPVVDACDYIRQAAMGLQHAHERGMVHRDVKPHNLMVTADGTVKILDFGLASLSPEAIPGTDSVEVRGDLTAAGAIMGTPDFISPEQANDARQVDIRSDIYSLGATMYYLLSGRPPFADGSVMHKLKSHAQVEPDSLKTLRDDVPDELIAMITKMMAKNPDERYLTPSEVANALEDFLRTWQPVTDGPQELVPSDGGGNENAGGQNAAAGDMGPNWLSVAAKWLFYLSLVPVAFFCLDLFFFSGETSVAEPDRTLFYLVASVVLSSIAGVLTGVQHLQTSPHEDKGNSKWAVDLKLIIAVILVGAVTYFGFAPSRSSEPYSMVTGGAGIDGEGWYFSAGNSYLKQDEPGVMFGMYEDPSGKRGFTYIVLVRHNGTDLSQASGVADAGVQFDGRTATLRDGFYIDGKGIKLDLDVHVSRAQFKSTELKVDGKARDASRGKLFLLDVTSNRAVWNQIDVELPSGLPAPESLVRDTDRVSAYAQVLKEQLARDNSNVREFLEGTRQLTPDEEGNSRVAAGARPNVHVESYNAKNGHHWQLTTQKVEAMRVRLLHIANGELEVASESVLRANGTESSTIDLTLSQTKLENEPESMTTSLEIASDDMQFSRSKGGPLAVKGTFQVTPVVNGGDLAWDEPTILYHLADWSGDLTYGRRTESMIEASKGNARFIALEIEWVAKDEVDVPDWFAPNQPTANNEGTVSDAEAIQGEWQVIFAEDSGRTGPPEAIKDIRMVITNESMTMSIAGRENESTYTLDPSTTPKSIDMTNDGLTKPGIYDLQGDTLRICFSENTDERPTAFDSQPNSVNDVVLTLKRVKPDMTPAADADGKYQDGPLTEELARSLIPEAASISNDDFQILHGSPSAESIKSKSLSLILMNLDIRDQSPEDANDFKFLVEGFPKPGDIAHAMSPSRSKGYLSIIQPDYITECKITNSTDDVAQGKVTFNAPKLYVGTATFEARKHQGKWRIEKFLLPSRQISVVLGNDGVWHLEGTE
ncbi:MAG: protein kinase [Planctomycetaceae bacterium]|nr:protein kinase [Planctomycetaceae bacterium]